MNSVFVFGYLSLNELIIDDRFIDLFRKGATPVFYAPQ